MRHTIEATDKGMKAYVHRVRVYSQSGIGLRNKRLECSTRWLGGNRNRVRYEVISGPLYSEVTNISTPNLEDAIKCYNEL